MFTRLSIYLRPKLFVVNIDLCWCITCSQISELFPSCLLSEPLDLNTTGAYLLCLPE